MNASHKALIALALVSSAACAATAPPDAMADGALRWRQIGPFRAGWATMVEGVPTKPGIFYAATAGGGLWRTVDVGRTWTSLFDKGPASSIGAIAVAPSNPDILYLGTGQPEPRYDVQAGLGVFKSVDGGRSWTSLGLVPTRYIGKIWIDPRDPDVVVVGAQGHFFGPSADRGIYRSADGGRTWAHVLAPGDWTGVVDIASDPANPDLLFASAWEAHQYPWQSYFTPVAGAGSALYRSSDGGRSWAKLDGAGWPAGPLGRIGIAVAHVSGRTRIYASVDKADAGGLYRSDDGGLHWARVNDETAFTSWYSSRLTIAPNDPDTVYTVGQSIRRCTGGGARCEIVRGSPGGDDYHHVWINPLHPDHMITGSDQGAAVSVDGGRTWSSWYNQPTGQFYHLATDDRFPYWIYSGQQDSGTVAIASRSDYGAISLRDWHPVGGDERDYDIPDPADPMIVYGSGLGGRVTKWDARTGQVQNVSPWPISSYGARPTLTRYHYNWVTPLVASRTGAPAIYLGAQIVFRSADQGRSWSAISGDLTGKRAGAERCDGDVAIADATACGYGTISALEPSARHADEIWVGTDNGRVQVTHDGGANWSNVTPPQVRDWSKIASLDVSRIGDSIAYAAVDGQRLDDFQPHVLRTRDGGKSWTPIETGLPRDHFVSVVRADPVREGLLFAGTDAGAYVSFDDGAAWQPLQGNLPTAWVRDLLVHGDDLIAATQGRAIWALDDVAPLREMNAALAREPAHLFAPAVAVRIHPNNNKDTPFAPETPLGENPPAGAVIDYWLGDVPKGPVVLEIRTADGQLVRRFSSSDGAEDLDAERYFAKGWTRAAAPLPASPGMHRFVWNLRYERPRAIGYGYSIAAVWGKDTPVTPEGPWVVPGDYRVTLRVDGRTFVKPLTVRGDPRITTTDAALRASLALSQRIGAALARARQGYGETQAVQAQVAALIPAGTPAPASGTSAADRAGLLPDQARAVADGLRQPPAEGQLSFSEIGKTLAAVETDLEAADTAPTPAQAAVVDTMITGLDAAWQRWDGAKARLAPLNAALRRAGRAPVRIPPPNELRVTAPDAGQDLP